MALWGKTDTLASKPKTVARKAYFDSTAVNTTAETINILSSNTGFATGDAVYYSINGGTVIGGLTNAATYYVRVVGAGLISLYDTYARAIDTGATTGRLNISGAGVGTHILQRTGAANEFGDHVQNGKAIVFVDAQEAEVADNKAKGITGPGWWLYRTYTDAQSVTRHKAECLIALANGIAAATAGDLEDTVTVDLTLTIDTGPANTSAVEGDTAEFTVVASTNAADTNTITYQWQKSDDAGETWASIVGATTDTYTTGALTVADDDADEYRVVVSVAGISVTSDAATLTVTAE